MAQLDPGGELCKVCQSCYEDKGISQRCTTRSLTESFQQFREQSKEEMKDILNDLVHMPEQPTFWKERIRIDISKECQRLLQGFKSSTSGIGKLNAVRYIIRQFRVPSWQKSTYWMLERQVTVCRYCSEILGNRKKNRNCKVCGLTLCKECSKKELLLYFEDGTRHLKNATVHLSIIRIIGCPDREPHCSMLLHCCTECKKEIVHRQIEDNTWYLENKKLPNVVSEIIRLDKQFREQVADITYDMELLNFDNPDESTSPDTIAEKPSAKPGIQEAGTKDEELEITKNRVLDSLNVFRKMYWDLYSEKYNDELTYKTSCFVMNYLSARNKFYIDTKSRWILHIR